MTLLHSVAQSINTAPQTCIHRRPFTRHERTNCCGRVGVFACPKLGHEVQETKCKSCTEYEAAPEKTAPLLFFCTSEGYRERHTTFFARPFAEAGWWVHHVNIDHSAHACGIPDEAARVGMPDGIVQWDEHGCAHANRPWREAVAWAYANDVAPLSIDFGYLGHYQHFAFDWYQPDGVTGSRHILSQTSGASIDWDAQTDRVRDYRRRVLRGYAAARDLPPLVDEPYVAVFMQQHSGLNRLPGTNNEEFAKRATAAIEAAGFRAVFKTAPSMSADVPFPDSAIVYRHEDVPNDTNQRLAVHAEYCLVISSSITNEFVLNNLPVVATGRSWFNGFHVFEEPDTWADLPTSAPQIDPHARNRYLRYWLDRQTESDNGGRALNAVLDEWRDHRPDRDDRLGSLITCVYAPNAVSERIASASLAHNAQAAGDAWRRIVAIDDASPALTVAASVGATTVTTDEGAPPRMGPLMAQAVAVASGRYILTAEQDTFFDTDQLAAAVEMMDALPNRVAALYWQSVTPDGAPEYPWTADWPRSKPWREGLRLRKLPTLSTTLWRRRAFQAVDFSGVPALEYVDGHIGERLASLGYLCLMTDRVQAVHLPHVGRKAGGGVARTLVIGYDRGIWAERGIRFGWNGDPSLDQRGAVKWTLPFDSDSFREIYLRDKLAHADEIGARLFVDEAHRVLRHGARLDLAGGGPIEWLHDDPRFRVVRWTDDRAVLAVVKEAADARE